MLCKIQCTILSGSKAGIYLFKIITNTVFLWLYNRFFFHFQNNPKDLDPSFKMDLDLWDCFGRVKLVL